MKKLKKYFQRILKVVKLDEMEILPGHLAFYFIFIIIPVVSFVGLISSNLNINYNYYINSIPNAVLSLINNINMNNDINIYIYMILSLYLASRGTRAIILTSNTLFKIKDKDEIQIRFRAGFMVIVLFILISFIVIVPILGDIIINYITIYFNDIGNIIINNTYHFLKYPISIIFMFLLIKMLYLMSPSINIESKYMNNGAVFTTFMWLILSRLYSYYLNNFNNYNLYFGSMGSILILLVWVYLLSYIFVIGLAINSDNYLVSIKEKKNNL